MWKWNKLSLRNQFLFIFILLQLIILGLVFYYFVHNQTEFYLEQLRLNLHNQAKLLRDNRMLELDNQSPAQIDGWVKEMGEEIGARITVIDLQGRVLADSRYNPEEMDNHRHRPEINRVIEGEETGFNTRFSKTLEQRMSYLAAPIYHNQRKIGVVRLSRSTREINQVIKDNIYNYFIFILAVLVVTLLLNWRFANSYVKPLNSMTRMASKIARGNFGERIQLRNFDNEVGTMARMFNYMADQLESKLEEISEEKNKAEAILTSMVDGVIATDRERQVLLVNPAAREMLGLGEEDYQGRELMEVLRKHKIDNRLGESIANREYLSEEVDFNNPERIFRCHFAPITGRNQGVMGGVIVFTDITELRKLEQVRKDFVANVSHELRTPLTSIIGYLDTLLESEIQDRETTNRFLKIIKKEADRLALLIRDLLKLSRLENNQPRLKPGRLGPILDKVVTVLQENAEEKNISLSLESGDTLPLVMMIPEQIEQVLINLVDNGIKYTPEGGRVTIRTYEDNNSLYVEVEDNGLGIPETDQERIFERFYRVNKARSRSLGGTGIGLSIVKHIIQGHNSQIEVESEVDQGTVFRFYLYKAN